MLDPGRGGGGGGGGCVEADEGARRRVLQAWRRRERRAQAGIEPRRDGGSVDATAILTADPAETPRVVRRRRAREGDAATMECLIGLSWNLLLLS